MLNSDLHLTYASVAINRVAVEGRIDIAAVEAKRKYSNGRGYQLLIIINHQV